MNIPSGDVSAGPLGDRDLDVLETIQTNSKRMRQRDISRALGMSLGMINAILHRLTQKGLLTIRKLNSRNIQYVVSPTGAEAIATRGYRYLRRTLGNVVRYRDRVDALITDAKRSGCTRIALVGESDLAFIVEHFAGKRGLPLLYEMSVGADPDTLWLVSESLGAVGQQRDRVISLGQTLVEMTDIGVEA
jgi:DNA-binding MarR family transcriptional regulator